MKKLIIILFILLPCKRLFAQLTFDGTKTDFMYIVSGGAHQMIINNPGFNNWVLTNYNTTIKNTIGVQGDLMLIYKGFDAGGYYSHGNPYGLGGGYAGRRITSPTSNVSSWLNIEAGGFFVNYYNKFPPINYTLKPDQVGQMLELHYNATYIGLSTRNYLNKARIRLGKHKGIAMNTAIFFSVDYEPFYKTWKYGYYHNDTDTTRVFRGALVNSIPKLNKVFMNAGISIGFGN